MISGGIHWAADRSAYKVRVRVGGVQRHVGYFEDLEDARRAFADVVLTGEVSVPYRRLLRVVRPPAPPALCACGCGEWASPGKTWLRGHHWRNGQEEYVVNSESGCWVWRLGVRHDGYGRYKRKGAEAERAHRAYWIRFRGAIPEGFHVHHECGNKLCVNPDHLECLSPVDHGFLHSDGVPYAA